MPCINRPFKNVQDEANRSGDNCLGKIVCYSQFPRRGTGCQAGPHGGDPRAAGGRGREGQCGPETSLRILRGSGEGGVGS